MLGDQRLRTLRIALVDRLVNGAVLPVILADHLGREDLLLHDVPLRVEPHLVDLSVDVDEERVARGPCDQKVELRIPL